MGPSAAEGSVIAEQAGARRLLTRLTLVVLVLLPFAAAAAFLASVVLAADPMAGT